jgi:hypothetical protein
MKEELKNKLKERFPFYKEMLIPGLPGDGWFQLLWDLSEGIEKILKDNPDTEFRVAQVKEKFGGLRFYWSCKAPTYEKIGPLVQEAEKKASETCEHCGEPGKERTGGWIKTLCDACEEKTKGA